MDIVSFLLLSKITRASHLLSRLILYRVILISIISSSHKNSLSCNASLISPYHSRPSLIYEPSKNPRFLITSNSNEYSVSTCLNNRIHPIITYTYY